MTKSRRLSIFQSEIGVFKEIAYETDLSLLEFEERYSFVLVMFLFPGNPLVFPMNRHMVFLSDNPLNLEREFRIPAEEDLEEFEYASFSDEWLSLGK